MCQCWSARICARVRRLIRLARARNFIQKCAFCWGVLRSGGYPCLLAPWRLGVEFSPDALTPSGIPRSLAPCFQEYDLERLDPAQHGDLIIERTLARGDRRELRWLFDRYGQARVTAWVRRAGARGLPWRRYNLWCVLLDLPLDRHIRERRIWPY